MRIGTISLAPRIWLVIVRALNVSGSSGLGTPRYAHIKNRDEDYLEITVIIAGLGGNTDTHTHTH